MTLEELLINKGVIDKDWNFLESGDEKEECHHLYCIKGTKHYSIVVICSILLALERRGAVLSKYDFAINANWLTVKFADKNIAHDCNNVLLSASHAMEDAFAMLKFIDGVTLIRMAVEMMRERVWR